MEVGAGRSTLWYARKGLQVTSVETDPKWFEFLHRELGGYHSVSLNLVDEHEVLKWLANLAPKHDVCVLDALPQIPGSGPSRGFSLGNTSFEDPV